jgi:GNAT superfamily N-acetyltransferase
MVTICFMAIVVRTAVASDMNSLSGIYRRASLSNQGDRDHLLQHPDSLIFSDKGIRQERTRVAVNTGGTIVGFASYLITDGMIELEDLFVDPSWMRLGVGTELVLDAIAIARERSFDRLEVTANPHAREFHRSMGFVTGQIVETDFYPGKRMRLSIR